MDTNGTVTPAWVGGGTADHAGWTVTDAPPPQGVTSDLVSLTNETSGAMSSLSSTDPGAHPTLDVSTAASTSTLDLSTHLSTLDLSTSTEPSTLDLSSATDLSTLDLSTQDPNSTSTTADSVTDLIHSTAQTLQDLNSTLISKLQQAITTDWTQEPTAPAAPEVTTGSEGLLSSDWTVDPLTTHTVTDKPRLTSMQIWFTITGSIVLAVIVLFCINACIQCKLCEKVAKTLKRRNHMAETEKRSHKDRDLMYGGLQEHADTHTHMFLHVHHI